ncbi:AsmA family protein [Sedimenticola hydrogenitrophicus]|uniref:AsmA family protein n=1 Tax=Sedimenticola hydrogenitrophicus TaxID=2967975 RepID=UPI0023B02444|nr:AsmA family protein [Sedimenticola hydrogenitrophicus]
MNTKTTILRILILLLILTPLVLIGILMSLDFNQYKPQVVAEVEALTGRKLTIEGDLELSISLRPSIEVSGVSLANAPWGSTERMASIGQLAVQVELLPLLSGDVRVTRLIARQADILLESNAKGEANWQFKKSDPGEAAPSAGVALPEISDLLIETARIRFLSATGDPLELTIDRLHASADTLVAPFDLSIEGVYNGEPLVVEGELESLAAMTSGGDLRFDLKLALGERKVQWQGEGEVVGALSRITLERFQLTHNQDSLTGSLMFDRLAQPPHLEATLATDRLDLRRDEKEADKQEAGGKLFSAAPLPLDAPQGLTADVRFSSKQVLGNRYTLNDLDATLRLEGGVLTIQPLAMLAGGGRVTGSAELNGNRSPASLALRLEGKDVVLGTLLLGSREEAPLQQGPASIDIDLKARGESVAALMGGLNGRLLISVGEGKINNRHLDLVGGDLLNQLFRALNPLADKEPYTEMECAVVNLQFSNGVAEYDKRVAILTRQMSIVSAGTIDLKNELLDVGFKPMPRGDTADLGITAGDLVSAARLTGPLSRPEMGLDAKGTAKAGLKLYGAIATGGTSLLLEGLWNKATSDDNPCQTALAKGGSAGGSKPSDQKGSEEGGFMDKLKGVFGN